MITVSGAPLPVLIGNGRWDAAKVLQDNHIFRSSGFELLEHLHFDEIAPHLSAVVADQDMALVRSCARRHFPADPINSPTPDWSADGVAFDQASPYAR